jgi:DNA-binding SARP family transcriptional activator
MPSLKLGLLGSPRLERDGDQVPLGRRKAMAILATLAVNGEPQTRESLLALLWPDYDASSGRTNLRRDLSYLRRTLGGEHLLADRNLVQLDQNTALWVDVRHFRNLLIETAGDQGVQPLAEAVALYAGDLMAGFSIPDAPDFDEWLFFERESLRRELATALQELVSHHAQLGEYEMAISYGRRWLSLDPLHESAHRELMKLYAWSGQQAAALRDQA